MRKFVSILLTVAMIFTVYAPIFAEEATGGTTGNIDTSEINGQLGEIVGMLLFLAGFVCIAKCIHIGILYVTSSANEKAQASRALMPWIIGAVVSFGFMFFGNMIINIIGGAYVDKPIFEY